MDLINNLKSKDIIILGATNFIDKVDNALVRDGRFQKFEVELAQYEERYDIAYALLFENIYIINKLIKNNVSKEGKMVKFMYEVADNFNTFDKEKDEAI